MTKIMQQHYLTLRVFFWGDLHHATPPPRLGRRDGFKDVKKAQVHAAATAAMNMANSSTHENVVGYDPEMLEQSCVHEIQMAQYLD